MRLGSFGMRLTASALATVALLAFGLAGTAQASQSPQNSTPYLNCNPSQCPTYTVKLSKVGKPHDVEGDWHDCAKVSPTPGETKSYNCSFTGTVQNTFSVSLGVTAQVISAVVGYSVSYSTSISGGTTYTPDNQKDTRGEVEWGGQYSAQELHAKWYLNGKLKFSTYGDAYHWIQPVTRFVPAGKIILVSETKGKWGKKHWKCKKRCP